MKTIKLSNEVLKAINKEEYYSEEQFIKDAKRYVKAIKERRMICYISSVSKSGMSRKMRFMAPERFKTHDNKVKYSLQNFGQFFKALGYKPNENLEITVNGAGMDMVFHTNYSICRMLMRMNIINKKACKVLEQETPNSIY